MSFIKNFDKMFIEPEDRSQEWDNKIFEYGESGDVEKLDKHLSSANELYFEEKQIYSAINSFTLRTERDEEKRRLLENLKKANFVNKLSYTDSLIKMEVCDGTEIRAYKMTGIIPDLKEDDPDIETLKRKGSCHSKSMSISVSMGIPNDVVTGYIFGFSDKAKYLHSWIEFKDKDREMIIDYSLNILMNKEGYYYMQHAIPLSRVSNSKLLEDKEIIKKFGKLGYFTDKEYLLYRDEIMKDFEKNKKLFNEER